MTGRTDDERSDTDNWSTGATGQKREQSNGVAIHHPETVSIDEQIPVEITDIPTETVDIHLTVTDTDGTDWTAEASYYAPDGELDIGSATSMDGTVEAGVADLLQQATPVTGEGRYSPDREHGDEITVEVSHDETVLGSTVIDRTFGDPSVTVADAGSDRFVGTVFEPPGAEPAPAVVVLHGSGGRPSYATAQLLASRGFVALALHYFDWQGRHGMLPAELVEVPLEFVESATEWLLDDDRVSGSKVGLTGTSKGGELALLAGSHLETVGPVVSVNGSGVVWGGLGTRGATPESSWTIDGEPVAQVPYTDDPSVWDARPPMELEPGYSQSYDEAARERVEEATIPVEGIDGPVLLVSGGEDRMWDSVTLQRVAAERLDSHGCPYEHRVYEDAGHGISFPYLPTANRQHAQQYVLGGSAPGYAVADRDHWPEVIETFETLRQ